MSSCRDEHRPHQRSKKNYFDFLKPGRYLANVKLGMGDPYLACGPYLAVAVPIVAETLTQAQNQPNKVNNGMRTFRKNLS